MRRICELTHEYGTYLRAIELSIPHESGARYGTCHNTENAAMYREYGALHREIFKGSDHACGA